ncbi:MAG: glucose-6-phosphate isomerase [Nitrospirae bacterium GWC2_57_13]|nr:MAG: glucose-6-phosphate isomerase [Nitrospirae bacterium GWC2_57_13]
MGPTNLWQRYKDLLCVVPSIGLRLDVSRMNFPDGFLSRMEPQMQKAFQSMEKLEKGAIANPDEKRMAGHYWLRAPERAPSPEIRRAIEDTLAAIGSFTANVHSGMIAPEQGGRFTHVLSIGIGGSALGPQFASDALGTSGDKMKPFFLDNTDPDGFDRVFDRIGKDLGRTLTIVISKSGGTIETRNGMLEAAAAYKRAGLTFEKHAVAVTGVGSKLDKIAVSGKWIKIFPMWDWVGGRTSQLSAVGLLPAALQGLYIEEMLKGASLCDEATRIKNTRTNPAAMLALSWFHAADGRGAKDMVILPYKDRLMLFPKYLQQLVMESLGKEKDLDGAIVNQGLAVYGNKGTTDQHAYVQQLRDGVNNFFATFIEVLKDRDRGSMEVEPGIMSGDYLSAFYLGTRNALFENSRESVTITIERFDARSLGALIALYERAVGFYASLVNVNAYHQPGVEAGKKMADSLMSLRMKVLAYLRGAPDKAFTVEEVASAINEMDQAESVFKILEHASANADHKITKTSGPSFFESRYQA